MLELLGADGLRNQFITVRVQNVDVPTFRRKVSSSPLAAAALYVTDNIPKAALDVGLGVAAKKLKEYGIDARITASNVPPAQGGRSLSEFFPGVAVGAGLVGGGWAVWHYLLRRLFV